MVLMWTSGDIFKTTYFILRDSPTQFWLCGMLQVSLDVAVLSQVYMYSQSGANLKKAHVLKWTFFWKIHKSNFQKLEFFYFYQKKNHANDRIWQIRTRVYYFVFFVECILLLFVLGKTIGFGLHTYLIYLIYFTFYFGCSKKAQAKVRTCQFHSGFKKENISLSLCIFKLHLYVWLRHF